MDIALAHIKYTLSAWLVVVYFSKRFLAIELINGHKYSLYIRNAYILIYMGRHSLSLFMEVFDPFQTVLKNTFVNLKSPTLLCGMPADSI